MHINSLNDKILIQIFNHLSIGGQMKCASVCRQWLKLVSSIKEEELAVFHSSPPKVAMSNVFIRTNNALDKLLNSPKFSDLKKLKIHINNQVISEPSIDLTNHLSLEHLEIHYFTANQKMFDILISKQVQLTSLRCLNVLRVDLTTIFNYFPNLTHIKAAFVDKINYAFELADCKLEYFEQNHHTPVDRNLIHFLTRNCPLIECLTLTVTNLGKIGALIQQFNNLREINFNISNESLSFCFKYIQNIFKAMAKKPDIIFRINGLRVKQSDTQCNKFKVDPDEIFLITYRDLQTLNQLCDYSKTDLEYYANNFKEIEITEKTLQIIKPLFVYDLILARIRKMTYHYSNRNSSVYFIDKFFPKIPNLEHLFIADVDGLTNDQLNKLPNLFTKLSNLEMHALKKTEFNVEFIRHFQYLQILVIQSNGRLVNCLHNVIKDLVYLTNIEIDPVYDEIIKYIENKSRLYCELRCHLHPFTSELKEEPIKINGVCRERHIWLDSLIFEDFNLHNCEY